MIFQRLVQPTVSSIQGAIQHFCARLGVRRRRPHVGHLEMRGTHVHEPLVSVEQHVERGGCLALGAAIRWRGVGARREPTEEVINAGRRRPHG